MTSHSFFIYRYLPYFNSLLHLQSFLSLTLLRHLKVSFPYLSHHVLNGYACMYEWMLCLTHLMNVRFGALMRYRFFLCCGDSCQMKCRVGMLICVI